MTPPLIFIIGILVAVVGVILLVFGLLEASEGWFVGGAFVVIVGVAVAKAMENTDF